MRKLISTIIIFLLALNIVSACADLSINLNPGAFIQGENNKIQLKITPASSPLDPFGVYTNATLDVPLELVNQSALFKNITTVADPTQSWDIIPSNLGQYLFNVTVMNSTGATCFLQKNVTVNPNVVPNITVTTDNFTTLLVNNEYNFTSIINNSGNGTAYDITKQISGDLATENIAVGDIINGSFNANQTAVSIGTCGQKTITVSAKNFHNGNFVPMQTVSTIDNFDVVGSDLNIVAFNPSDTKPNAGATITVNATVKNLANTAYSYNATGSNFIKFYYNSTGASTLIESIVLNNSLLTMNATESVMTSWTVPNSGGNYTVYANLVSENECDTTNNLELASIESQGVVTSPTTTPSTGGSGSSSSGGGTGFIRPAQINFELTKKVTKLMKKLYSVEFEVDGEKHSAKVDSVSSDTVYLTVRSKEFKLAIPLGETEKIDFEKDGFYDMAFTIEDITNYVAKVTFERIDEAYEIPTEPVQIPDDVIIEEKPVEPISTTEEPVAPIENVTDSNDDLITGNVVGSRDTDSLWVVYVGLVMLILSLLYVFRKPILAIFVEEITKEEVIEREEVTEEKSKKEDKKNSVKEEKSKEKKPKKSLKDKLFDIFFEEV